MASVPPRRPVLPKTGRLFLLCNIPRLLPVFFYRHYKRNATVPGRNTANGYLLTANLSEVPMSMADISAIFATLLALGIAFPGMLTAWWLLFPQTVRRAQLRFTRTPGRCFALGLLTLLFLAVPLALLFAIPGPGQLVASVLLFALLGIATIGAAGIAAVMGERLATRAGGALSPLAAFLRGAIALELAAAFPLVGWFIFIPVAIVISLGATTFALLRWVPAMPAPLTADTTVPQL